MNRLNIFLTAIFASYGLLAVGQTYKQFGVANLDISHPDSHTLAISMDVTPSSMHLKRNQLVRLMPILISEERTDSVELPAYTVAGKNQYYYTLRSSSNTDNLYYGGSANSTPYSVTLPWQDWMATSTVEFRAVASTCCGKPVGEEKEPVAKLEFVPPVLTAELEYVEPPVTLEKEYVLEGRAYVNFPVNRTEIFPDYMNNPVELRKITNSIDTVRNNPDATIETITLTGYASPEGPYLNNVRLAKGRTEALKEYVRKLYSFPANVFITNSVPEDWAGLREAIEKESYPDAAAMIAFIDSDYPIEKRNDRFRELFPKEYADLLKYVYPRLRHTDYLVKYNIKKFTDVEEIKTVMLTRPQNLSLDEFYAAANSYPVGSPEYDEVFDIAVRMYPQEPTANLNAANSAMRRGDFDRAAQLLQRAGKGENVDYAWGVYYARQGDYDAAMKYLTKLPSEKSGKLIDSIEKIRKYQGGVTFLQPE